MKKTIKRELKSPAQWGLAAIGAIAGIYQYLPELKLFLPPAVIPAVSVAAIVLHAIKGKLDAGE